MLESSGCPLRIGRPAAPKRTREPLREPRLGEAELTSPAVRASDENQAWPHEQPPDRAVRRRLLRDPSDLPVSAVGQSCPAASHAAGPAADPAEGPAELVTRAKTKSGTIVATGNPRLAHQSGAAGLEPPPCDLVHDPVGETMVAVRSAASNLRPQEACDPPPCAWRRSRRKERTPCSRNPASDPSPHLLPKAAESVSTAVCRPNRRWAFPNPTTPSRTETPTRLANRRLRPTPRLTGTDPSP